MILTMNDVVLRWVLGIAVVDIFHELGAKLLFEIRAEPGNKIRTYVYMYNIKSVMQSIRLPRGPAILTGVNMLKRPVKDCAILYFLLCANSDWISSGFLLKPHGSTRIKCWTLGSENKLNY